MPSIATEDSIAGVSRRVDRLEQPRGAIPARKSEGAAGRVTVAHEDAVDSIHRDGAVLAHVSRGIDRLGGPLRAVEARDLEVEVGLVPVRHHRVRSAVEGDAWVAADHSRGVDRRDRPAGAVVAREAQVVRARMVGDAGMAEAVEGERRGGAGGLRAHRIVDDLPVPRRPGSDGVVDAIAAVGDGEASR